MLFNTWTYACFLILGLAAYWSIPARTRPYILTVFGCVFYWWYFPPHLPLILGLTVLVYLGAKLIYAQKTRRRSDRALFVVATTGAVGVLAYYKYMGFIWNSISTWGGYAGVQITIPELTYRPPLAISFFTFEFVHYLFEVHRGTIKPDSFRKFILFIMFFPTLICGPIKRYNRFEGQITDNRFEADNVFAGLQRIIVGLAKKLLIADAVGAFCLPILYNPDLHTQSELWLGAYGYAIHIYFDFAGYSDIAIGSALLLGFHVPENFNYPYLQTNIANFWRAWHMSLTSWITDYVYIPLGGNRKGTRRAYWNRLTSMTLCGLWHGAAFHFVVWGALHGMAINIHRAYTDFMAARGWQRENPTVVGRITATALTFHFVVICWVYFVTDAPAATMIVGRMLGLIGGGP